MRRRILSNPSSRAGGNGFDGVFLMSGRAETLAQPVLDDRALPSATQTPFKRRRGVSIVEMIATAVLISVAMTAAVPLLALAAVQSQTARQHQIALLEVANVMERIAIAPPRELRELEEASERPISDTARKYLPEARLQVHAVDVPGPPAALRLTVQLTWKDRAGASVAPVRLVKWFYPAAAKTRTRSNELNP